MFKLLVPSARTLWVGVAVAVALAALRGYGLSVADLAHFTTTKFKQSISDSKAVMSGEYVQRTADKLRTEAAALPSAVPAAHDNEDPKLARELMAERKRILEERADYLQQNAVQILKGDTRTLQKQVEEKVRQAGGNY
jgi:hypothetical protein